MRAFAAERGVRYPPEITLSTKRKRHHYVPQFYLLRFADEGGLLWLHDLERGTAVQVQPKDMLAEKYFYAPEIGDDPTDGSLEEFIGPNVEEPAIPAIGKLVDGQKLSADERNAVALFVAFQEVRVPRMRAGISEFASQLGTDMLRLSASDPVHFRQLLKRAGVNASETEIDHLMNLIKGDKLQVRATKIPWLDSFPIAAQTADMLTRMPWTIVEAHADIQFATSDAPISKVVTDPQVPRQFSGGWLSPSAESTIALDTRHCLVIRPDGTEGRAQGDKVWCDDVNGRLIAQATRYVVTQDRDEYVEALSAGRRTDIIAPDT